MKRRIKKELLDYAIGWFTTNRPLCEEFFQTLNNRGYLSEWAFEPEPFECWVCNKCWEVHSADFKPIDFSNWHKHLTCKGTPLKMIQKVE